MAVNDLTFRQTGKHYETEFVSEGKAVVQLVRPSESYNKRIVVYAHLEGLQPSLVLDFYEAGENVIFELDIPQGVTVTIVSETAVKQAKMSVV